MQKFSRNVGIDLLYTGQIKTENRINYPLKASVYYDLRFLFTDVLLCTLYTYNRYYKGTRFQEL